MKISKFLELEKEAHEELGEVFLLKSEMDEDGHAAFYVEEEEEEYETKTGKPRTRKYDSAAVIRLSKSTAIKLAWQILKELGE